MSDELNQKLDQELDQEEFEDWKEESSNSQQVNEQTEEQTEEEKEKEFLEKRYKESGNLISKMISGDKDEDIEEDISNLKIDPITEIRLTHNFTKKEQEFIKRRAVKDNVPVKDLIYDDDINTYIGRLRGVSKIPDVLEKDSNFIEKLNDKEFKEYLKGQIK